MSLAAGKQAPVGLVVVALAALLSTAGPAAAKKKEGADLSDWPDGPVRYIIEKHEAETFKRLETDEARTLFIERFWSRRDPTPETLLTNEYRRMFWERVQESKELFMDSSKPGWMTDRGKIHILYGPPTEIQEDRDLVPNSGPTSGQGVIRWIYEGRPGERMDMNPVVVVPFVRDTGGEYRLTYDPKLASVFFDPNKFQDNPLRGYERWLEMVSTPMGRSDLSVMLDLGRMQEVPPQQKILMTQVETLESYDTEPLSFSANRFRHPDEGTVLVTTVDVSNTGPDYKPAIIARYQPQDGGEPRLLSEAEFRMEDRDGGVRLAEGRIALPPGDYLVTVIVADPQNATTGLGRSTVAIRPPGRTPRFSDVVLAAELESLPYASLASYDEPFIVGPFRVLPRMDDVLLKGESLKLLYEVYDVAMPFRVTYQLQGLDTDGSWVDLGRPSTAEQASITQAWELPTNPRWPDGDYRVRIEVLDGEGRLIATDVPFELVTDRDAVASAGSATPPTD
jgi:GWxTD domain-containing protein